VNVLTAQQRQLCLTFADGGGRDKFAATCWHRTPSGSPVIEGALAWLDCRIESVQQAGDHFLVLARVEHLQGRSGDPLMFYRGGFGTFSADSAPRPRGPSRLDWTADNVWGTGLWQEGLDW
jgi:flavin reductase (DIM6/NTAB) family NADH-FMN oxidoreductase RutF